MIGKREFLRLFGGVGAAAWAGAATGTPAMDDGRSGAHCLLVWGHGLSLSSADPARLQLAATADFTHRVTGASFSTNRLLIPFPLPPATAGRPPRIAAIRLRFRVGEGARLEDVALNDGEVRVARHEGLAQINCDWSEERVEFSGLPAIRTALGLSLGVAFAATEREFELGAIGVELVA